MIEDEEFLPVRLPPTVYDRIEQSVVSMYVELKIHTVPIKPFEIAHQLGYVVKKFSQIDHKAHLKLNEDESEGISHFDPNLNTSIIYFDDSVEGPRRRFTVMHEIGHIRLGHREESILAKRMADYFAAYSLAPSPLIAHFKCEDFIDIGNTFDLSLECADICFRRYCNWASFGKLKPYEHKLLDLFQ